MKTEGDIMNNLKQIGKDTTCVIIAHRLSTVQDCDLIVVMDNGRVVEIGSHEDLVRLGGKYSRLLAFQKSLGSDTADTKTANLEPV
jgi:ABC-type multidrug transport system fused ATPase/permease subunit